MQRLDLNLATNPARNTTLVWTSYALAAVVLGALTWANVSTYQEQRALGQQLESQVGTFAKEQRDLEQRAQRARKAIEDYDLPALHVQASKARQIIDWKTFSWTRLFNLMERIQPGGVRMNNIRPVFYGSGETGDPREAGGAGWGVPVSVEGTARTLGDLADFQQAILDDPHFAFVLPEHLSRADSGEILFQLRFHYQPVLEPDKTPPKPKPEKAETAAGTAREAPAEPDEVAVDDRWAEVGGKP